jgi:hypothetical protein
VQVSLERLDAGHAGHADRHVVRLVHGRIPGGPM